MPEFTPFVAQNSSPPVTGGSSEVTLAAVRERLPSNLGSNGGILVEVVAGSVDSANGTADFTETNARLGSRTEATATNVTAASGLNGLFRAILSQFIDLINLLPASLSNDRLKTESILLGDLDNAPLTFNPVPVAAKAVTGATYAPGYTEADAAILAIDKTSGGLLTHCRKLTIAQDQVTVEVKTNATSVVNSIVANTTLTVLSSSNTTRQGCAVTNNSTADCYLKLGDNATTISFSKKLLPDEYYPVPFNYSGIVTAVWATATGEALVTEIFNS